MRISRLWIVMLLAALGFIYGKQFGISGAGVAINGAIPLAMLGIFIGWTLPLPFVKK